MPNPKVLGNYRDDETEVVEGGSGDWHYLFTSCIELTVEVNTVWGDNSLVQRVVQISCEKRPRASSIPQHWTHNCRQEKHTLGINI